MSTYRRLTPPCGFTSSWGSHTHHHLEAIVWTMVLGLNEQMFHIHPASEHAPEGPLSWVSEDSREQLSQGFRTLASEDWVNCDVVGRDGQPYRVMLEPIALDGSRVGAFATCSEALLVPDKLEGWRVLWAACERHPEVLSRLWICERAATFEALLEPLSRTLVPEERKALEVLAETPLSEIVAVAGLAQANRERKLAGEQMVEHMCATLVAERLMALVVSSSHDAILTKDLDGVILNWSTGCEALYGFTKEEAVGRRLDELIVPESRRAELGPIFERLRQGEIVPVFETVRQTASGTVVDVEVHISPVWNARGEVFAASAVARNITERKSLQRELHRAHDELQAWLHDQATSLKAPLLTSLVESLREGCQVLSRDFRYLYINDAVVRHGKASREQLMGRKMGEAYPGIEDTVMFKEVARCMKERTSGKMLNAFEFEDGTVGWFDLRFTPVPAGLAVLSIDITEQIQAQRDLRRSVRELEEFAEAVAHDLQSPLRRLVLFSQSLQTQLEGVSLSDMANEDLEAIIGSAKRMQKLIQGQLDLARMRQHELHLTEVEASDCVDAALELLSTQVEELSPVIHREALPRVKADASLLTQIYQNLLDNAFKYRSDAPLEITLTAEQQGRFVWVLGVRDNGIGIAEKHLSRIFRPLKRLHGSSISGIGIGLALCRRAVHRLGGEIWVDSEGEGRGSHFQFSLRTISP